jgi:hypothetical protein
VQRRARWFPSPVHRSWLGRAHRESAFQVGQLAGLRLTRTSGQPCSRPPRSQTSLLNHARKAVGCDPVNQPPRVASIAELKSGRSLAPPVAFPQADLRAGGFSRSWRRLPRSIMVCSRCPARHWAASRSSIATSTSTANASIRRSGTWRSADARPRRPDPRRSIQTRALTPTQATSSTTDLGGPRRSLARGSVIAKQPALPRVGESAR